MECSADFGQRIGNTTAKHRMVGIAGITLVSLEGCITGIVNTEVLGFLLIEAIAVKQATVKLGQIEVHGKTGNLAAVTEQPEATTLGVVHYMQHQPLQTCSPNHEASFVFCIFEQHCNSSRILRSRNLLSAKS